MDALIKSDKFKNLKQIIKPPRKTNSVATRENSKTTKKPGFAKCEVVTNSSVNLNNKSKIYVSSLNGRKRDAQEESQYFRQRQVPAQPIIVVDTLPSLHPKDSVMQPDGLNASQIHSGGLVSSVRHGLDPNASRGTFAQNDARPFPNTFMKDDSGFLIPQRTNTFKQWNHSNYLEKSEKEYFDAAFSTVESDYISNKCHSYIVNVIRKKAAVPSSGQASEINAWMQFNQISGSNCAVSDLKELSNYQSFHDTLRFNLNPVNQPTINGPPSNVHLLELWAERLKLNSREKLIYLLKDWTLVRNENSDLFLSGTLLNMQTEEVLEDCHVSSKIVKRINSTVVSTHVCTYILQGEFQDTNNGVPKKIKAIFKNECFPATWKSLAEQWGKHEMSYFPKTSNRLYSTDDIKRNNTIYEQTNRDASYSSDADTSSTGEVGLHEEISYKTSSRVLRKRKHESNDTLGNKSKRQKGGPRIPERMNSKNQKTNATHSTMDFTMTLRSRSKAETSSRRRITNKQRLQHLDNKGYHESTEKKCICSGCTPKGKKINSRQQTPGPPKMSRWSNSLSGSD